MPFCNLIRHPQQPKFPDTSKPSTFRTFSGFTRAIPSSISLTTTTTRNSVKRKPMSTPPERRWTTSSRRSETVLPSLTHETLKELGVTAVGHRLKLLDAVAALRADASGKKPSVDAATRRAVGEGVKSCPRAG